MVELLEVADDLGEPARGIVEGAHGLVDPAEGVLGELDDGFRVTGGQERTHAPDRLVDGAGPWARRARVAAAAPGGALGSEGVGEGAAELGQVERAAGLRDLEQQLVLQRRVALDLGHHEVDQSLLRQRGEVLAQLSRRLLRQLRHEDTLPRRAPEPRSWLITDPARQRGRRRCRRGAGRRPRRS